MITSAEQFIELRSSKILEEYQRAAWDEAPEEVWHEVIEKYPEYKYWVAHNKSVSHSILRRLASDPDPRIRRKVAQRRRAGIELLRHLARDPDYTVRRDVATNPKVPIELLRELLHDQSEFIRNVAAEQIRVRGLEV